MGTAQDWRSDRDGEVYCTAGDLGTAMGRNFSCAQNQQKVHELYARMMTNRKADTYSNHAWRQPIKKHIQGFTQPSNATLSKGKAYK